MDAPNVHAVILTLNFLRSATVWYILFAINVDGLMGTRLNQNIEEE
jgi:hypothetical protein